MNKQNKKGFTLAELLIVVAIIAVLVAIAIPIFTNQLEKSREATDLANVRSAYAAVVTNYFDHPSSKTVSVSAQQTISGWQTYNSSKYAKLKAFNESGTKDVSVEYVKKGGKYQVNIDSKGEVKVTAKPGT